MLGLWYKLPQEHDPQVHNLQPLGRSEIEHHHRHHHVMEVGGGDIFSEFLVSHGLGGCRFQFDDVPSDAIFCSIHIAYIYIYIHICTYLHHLISNACWQNLRTHFLNDFHNLDSHIRWFPHVSPCNWWVLVHPHVFDVYILYLSPFLMFVYANAGATGVEEKFFFYILHRFIYIHTHVVWVGWGGAITFHCTYKLVALDIHTSCYASGCSLALDIGVGWGNNVTLHLHASSPALDIHASKSAQRMQRPVSWMETCGIGFTLW